MKQIETKTHSVIVNVHNNNKWETHKSCHQQDLIIVNEGVQCANCGALVIDNNK